MLYYESTLSVSNRRGSNLCRMTLRSSLLKAALIRSCAQEATEPSGKWHVIVPMTEKRLTNTRRTRDSAWATVKGGFRRSDTSEIPAVPMTCRAF